MTPAQADALSGGAAMSDGVTLARKSYEHLLRTRDRALREAEWEREHAESTRRWAEKAFDEQRRLSDRLNRVCFAAAALGVPIRAINEALDASEGGSVHNHPPYRPVCNERRLEGGQLRGACLNDDGTERRPWGGEGR